MKREAIVVAALLGVGGSAFSGFAAAQSALGGSTKHPTIGGPAKQYTIGGPANPNSPAPTVRKSGVTTGSAPSTVPASATSTVKCAFKGACVGPTKAGPGGT